MLSMKRSMMIPIEQASEGVLVFLTCGCCGFRARLHPSGAAALVLITESCEEHVGYDQPLGGVLLRSVPKGELVSRFVRTPLRPDSITTR
jgi:hypothetical protein